ncbi:hypothetical protein LguiA_002247 [Lonicera macranthoides]
MADEVLMRLLNLLVELRDQLLEGCEILAEPFHNRLRWIMIDLEFVGPEGIEGLIVEARSILYDAGQLFGSINHFARRRIFHNLIRRYGCMMKYYQATKEGNSFELKFILQDMEKLIDSVDVRSLSDYLLKWIQENQGSSTIASGGQLVGVAEDEDCFVGLDEQVDLLLPYLVNEGGAGGAYRFVCLWGMGGLGKTAIAKAIYNHPDVRGHFSRFSWASAPNERSDGDILQGIRDDLLPGWQRSAELGYTIFKKKSAEEDQKIKVWLLAKQLKKLLQNEKCLIVLDDIMSPGVLDVLHKALSKGERTRSRIVLTTRNLKLYPSHQSPQCLIYVPRLLNDDQSWELLQKTATRNQGKMNNHLNRETCKELVRRCGGLPLAIVQLGKLMQTEEWCLREALAVPEIIFKSVPMKGRVLEVLATIYDELPNELRPCFLYLRNVPADVEIEVNKLLHLWVAESLIPSHGLLEGESTLHLAYYYLHILASRSMVQLQVDEATGLFKYFRVHTLLRDVCFLKGKEEDLQVMDLRLGERVLVEGKEVITTMPSSFPICRMNKFAIYLCDLKDLDNYVPPKRGVAGELHSVLFFLERYFPRSRISYLVQSHLRDFKKVQVLDLGGLVFSNLDKSIGKLKHLKYLGLRYTIFHRLPPTIANMTDLQTLDLWDDGTQYACTSIPNVLEKLKELRHLYLRSLPLSGELQSRKMQLAKLRNLETLENFDLRVFNVEDLPHLNNLRKLGAIVTSKDDLGKIVKYLVYEASELLSHVAISIKYCDLCSEDGQTLLEKLLRCSVLRELSIDGRTGMLPDCDKNFCGCLTTLTLESCQLKEDPMGTVLEKLPKLRSLFLKWNAYAGREMVCSESGFPQLRVLQIHRIRYLENWRVDEGAMPNLFSLEIISCPNLKMVPYGLQFITTLQKLKIRWMPEEFSNRVRWEHGKTGEDFYKVRHVPSINIINYDGTEAVRKEPEGGVFIRGGSFGVETWP